MKKLSYLSVLLCFAASSSFAEESLENLVKRTNLKQIASGIQKGDRNVFNALPARGYKNGISGILNKYNFYAHPAYSFAECGETAKITGNGRRPGCIVSIKLARKLSNGGYNSVGVRIEYAIGVGERQFVPNNSSFADDAVSGNGLESKLQLIE